MERQAVFIHCKQCDYGVAYSVQGLSDLRNHLVYEHDFDLEKAVSTVLDWSGAVSSAMKLERLTGALHADKRLDGTHHQKPSNCTTQG